MSHRDNVPKPIVRGRELINALLVSLSDTQIFTSIALLITANTAVGCKITAYHYDLVCQLVLISSAAHMGSMAVAHKSFGRSLCLGIVRSLLLVASLGLGWVLFIRRGSSPIFPLDDRREISVA